MTSRNRWKLPDLGLGVGLRTTHFPHILEHWPQVDFFEIVSENFLCTDGRPMRVLDRIAERYPIVMHGVSLSIGSTDPIDRPYLRQLKALAKRIGAVWLGDHVCFTGVLGRNTHDLLPLPYNEATLKHVVRRIKVVQDILERPLVLENPSTYVTFQSSTMREEEFLAEMARASQCGLLLDVNNIYVTCRNHDLDPWEYLKAIPDDHVVQIHLAGHTDHGTHCIDTHNGRVIPPVWKFYEAFHRRAGGRATLLEWDADIPPFPVVHAEVKKAARHRARAEASR